MSTYHVAIYTDGGCSPNPGLGGWGAILIDDQRGLRKEISGFAPASTNQRMELTAAIEALRALKVTCYVTLYTDSQYLKNGITEWLPNWIARGWRTSSRKPVQNRDLWEALHAECLRHDITWEWVRGHVGRSGNEDAHRLVEAARAKALEGGAG